MTSPARRVFHPWPYPDGTPHPDYEADVIQTYDDGLSRLHVHVPGKPVALVFGRQGRGHGQWSEVAAVVVEEMASDPVPSEVAVVDQPAPAVPVDVSVPLVEPAPMPVLPPPIPVGEVVTCKMCFRRHRGDPMYCDRCAGEVGARGHAPSSRRHA